MTNDELVPECAGFTGDFLNRIDYGVDFFECCRIAGAEAEGAAGSRGAERIVHSRSALQAGAALNVVGRVEGGCEFLWIVAFDRDADDACAIRIRLRAMNSDDVDFA